MVNKAVVLLLTSEKHLIKFFKNLNIMESVYFFKWFKSFLTDRKQYVFYNGESSDLKPITCGPLLFLIYINDLPNISNKLIFFLFADDTNIYFESDDLLNVEKTVNEEL